jgi:FixJ family two-component response regulator
MFRGIPVIVVTGVGDCRGALEARGSGPPEAYMEKPIDQEAFLGIVKRLMAGSSGENDGR